MYLMYYTNEKGEKVYTLQVNVPSDRSPLDCPLPPLSLRMISKLFYYFMEGFAGCGPATLGSKVPVTTDFVLQITSDQLLSLVLYLVSLA